MNYSVAISESLNEQTLQHLIREDGQEDLCFALYNPSYGATRLSGVLKELILPEPGERNVHGNVSFNAGYLDRVTSAALEKKMGVCFLHSHPGPGWQNMSSDDIRAEEYLAPTVKVSTGLPLIGLTAGNDGTWSARFWVKEGPKKYTRHWCETVRVVGKGIRISFNDAILPAKLLLDEFQRTISAWGNHRQMDLVRLRVGIVGLGSVGSIIAESLLRTGVTKLTLIGFDRVEKKNLDRILGVKRSNIGQFKTQVIKARLLDCELDHTLEIKDLPFSICEKEGLEAALDCDVLFSCVDRPWPRFVLDCLAYANVIPLIDGGIEASINSARTNLDQARWKAHTVGPGRICMQCLGQYVPEDVALEQSGLLEDPTYLSNLPRNHFAKRGENVFGFSLGLAGMEIQQLLSLLLQPRNQYYGPKEFDFNTGNIDFDFDFHCRNGCAISSLYGDADKVNKALIGDHPLAVRARMNEPSKNKSRFSFRTLISKLKTIIN
jgi:hypothetical protein